MTSAEGLAILKDKEDKKLKEAEEKKRKKEEREAKKIEKEELAKKKVQEKELKKELKRQGSVQPAAKKKAKTDSGEEKQLVVPLQYQKISIHQYAASVHAILKTMCAQARERSG